MKILIVDYYCASNRGDAAILEGVIASLRKYFPDTQITVITNYPSSARIINQVNSLKQVMVPFKWTNLRKNIACIYALVAAVFSRRGIILPGMQIVREKLLLEPYIEADLVVSTGGSFLNDFYAPGNLGRLWGLYFAKLLGKSVVLYAQSIGPLNRTPYRQVARYVLNKVDLITLRDSRSKEILKSIGVNKPPIYVTADAAFTMPLISLKPIQLWRYEDNIPMDNLGLKVSISVRKWHYYTISNGHKRYVATIAALADWLISEKNAQIIFISTCTGFDGYHNDDRIVAHEVVECMKYRKKKNPLILCSEYTPQELSAIYGYIDLHIGTRMHSNILAMLSGTPLVAVQYEFKTAELMRVFGLEDYLLDINHIKFEDLIEKVDKALANREQIKNQISSKLPEIKIKSQRSAQLIFDLVKGKGVKKL